MLPACIHALPRGGNQQTTSFTPQNAPPATRQILESVIRFKWGALPAEQREGVRNFLSNLIISYTTDEALFRSETTFVNKLNIILVQILKHDWPSKWKTFIPDLVSASKTSETLCENSMKIFKLLSEEVFDFARLDLTQVGCGARWPGWPGWEGGKGRGGKLGGGGCADNDAPPRFPTACTRQRAFFASPSGCLPSDGGAC